MKKLIIFMLLINVLIIANGQNADKKWGIGVFGGKTEYNGDYGNAIFQWNRNFEYLVGGSFSRYLNKSFNVTLQGSYGDYGYSLDTLARQFKGTKIDGQLLLIYKLNNGAFIKENARIAPFVTLGGGVVNYDTDSASSFVTQKSTDLLWTVGLGFRFNFTDWIGFQYQFLYNFTSGDKSDFYEGRRNDAYATHSAGLVFSFGGKKDTDKDGVPDKLDKCPNTPLNIKVDVKGCPIDIDKDGVPDYLDKCPNVKGLVAFQGCPDTDGDGIIDSLDKCPTVKGLKEFQGCPDTDGDSIPDAEDKCPKVKGLKEFQGCPDTDGDGVQDSLDRCPAVKGLIYLKGCPDRDNDSIADIDDKCPDVFGSKANKGCPEVKAFVKTLFRKALQGIKFATNKDIILKPSFPLLDQIASVMRENPSYKLIINGHTDNVGDEYKNKDLSERRSYAVKSYLAKRGVEESRMKAKGFGDTMPVADNKTAKGKKENRRVEFIVEF